MQSQQGVADGPSRILSFDCLLMNMFPNGGEPPLRLYYFRLIMYACLPFLIYFFSNTFWAIYGRCKRIHEKERGDKATATSIIVLFLFYPTIVSIIGKSLNCIEIEGTRRLFDDLEEECFTGTHLLILLTVSMPGLIAWAAGIPIFALIKLYRNVGHLEEIRQKAAGKEHEDLLRSFKVRLGFLTAGYNDNYFYWEIVLLMRKTLLVLIIVFLSSVSSGVQSLSSVLILTIFFTVHWRLQPYYDEQLNRMETLSLFVIILTIYFGLYYQTGEGEPAMQNDVVTWVVFVAVLVPSIVFAVNFLRKMWIEVLKVVAGKSAKAFRFLTCGSIDITQFRRKHMEEESDNEGDKDVVEGTDDKNRTLQGFRATENDYAKQLKEKMERREQMRLEREARERSEESVVDSSISSLVDHESIKYLEVEKRSSEVSDSVASRDGDAKAV